MFTDSWLSRVSVYCIYMCLIFYVFIVLHCSRIVSAVLSVFLMCFNLYYATFLQ